MTSNVRTQLGNPQTPTFAPIRAHIARIPSLRHVQSHFNRLPKKLGTNPQRAADKRIWEMVAQQLSTSWPTRNALVNRGASAVDNAESGGLTF
jgi:hypothetical protein